MAIQLPLSEFWYGKDSILGTKFPSVSRIRIAFRMWRDSTKMQKNKRDVEAGGWPRIGGEASF
jgi:hypothetical protein